MVSVMEQHAVPQDITGFKFKLVGDMTLKQFGELAFGAIMAYLFFASNWNPFLKLPLTIFFGLLGVGLAFFPIEERPLDIWIINFFRAIYRPTYYIWKKDTSGLAFAIPQPSFTDTATTPMTITPPDQTGTGPAPIESGPALWPFPKAPVSAPAGPPLSPTEVPVATGTKAGPLSTPTPPTSPVQKPLLSIDELTKLRDAKIKELEIAQKKLAQPVPTTPPQKTPPPVVETPKAPPLESAPKQEGPALNIDQLAALRDQKATTKAQESSAELMTKEAALNALIEQNKDLMRQIDELKMKLGSLSGEDTSAIQAQIDTLSSQKNDVASKITALRSEVTSQRVAPISSAEYQTPKVVPATHVVKPQPQPATITLTELPNVINGVVEDANGSALVGVILIIKDEAGNSIRAFKTNKIGQFIVSTPLENGTYLLEMEKPDYVFDTFKITLTGQVLAPLEIKAKSNSPQSPTPITPGPVTSV